MNYNNINILVNTTDNFEDCWIPFFTLFVKNYPNFKGKIFLNTELKEFTFPDLNIISIKNKLTNKSWSECLNYALNAIQEDNILYLQDDYFISDKINEQKVIQFYNLFVKYKMDCLHLTDQCTPGPFVKNTEIDEVWEIKTGAEYRLSTQAAFWKKESLQKLIVKWENGWQFEHFGSKRSNYLIKKAMVVNLDHYGVNKNEIIPYIFTGIIKGKWKNEVANLFELNNIYVDFSKRGFAPEKAPKSTINFNKKKLHVYMNNLRSWINYMKLRLWLN